MKKVLHRSFKPAKCKIALQMASSRLKILKNKKDIQIKQLRRELAQLLESGQDQTARIRVEHVVSEEKTVAAYELVGIYCELLVTRLAVIDSQKNCPSDLKEAVASVLFASQRFADVPELSDVVKHFTAKYGKDFRSAASELRPDCGVSRLLVEKLSVKAPDGPTKVKILTEIAKEHNVKWEPKSFGEPDPKATEVLMGPSSFESASRIHEDSRRFQEKEPSNFPASPVITVAHGRNQYAPHVPVNSYAHDRRPQSNAQHVAPADVYVNKTSDSYHQNVRHSGTSTDRGEYRHPDSGDGNSSPMSQHNWKMKFADATAAAQAAAESAERASMAARAAAELSSRERLMRQNSTESQYSTSSYNVRHEPPFRQSSLKSHMLHFTEEQPSPRRNSRMQYEDVGDSRQNSTSGDIQNDGLQKNDRPRWTEASVPTNGGQSENAPWNRRGGRHSQESSSEMRQSDSFGEPREKKQPSEPDTSFGYSEEVQLIKRSSQASSRSHSKTFSDENVVGTGYIKSPSVFEGNIFAMEDKDHAQSITNETDSRDDDHYGGDASFDDYSSFFDKPKFDAEDVHDEPEYGLGSSLLRGKSPAHISKGVNAWSFPEDCEKSPRENSPGSYNLQERYTSPVFDDVPTSSTVPLHVQESSVKYDDYNRDSESEKELSSEEEISGGKSIKGRLHSTFQVFDTVAHDFFPSDTDEPDNDSRTLEETKVETQTALRFGALTGGLRHKKMLPPYRVSPARDATSSKPENEYTSTNFADQSLSSSAVASSVFSRSRRKEIYSEKVSNTGRKLSSTPPDSSSSDDNSEGELAEHGKRSDTLTHARYLPSRITADDSVEELPKRAQERNNKQTRTEDHKRSSSDEEEEKVNRNASNASTRLNHGLSRRTNTQQKASQRSSFSARMNNEEDSRRYRTKPQPESRSQQSSRPHSESKRPVLEENNSSSRHRPSASSQLPKNVASVSAKVTGGTKVETPSKEKASHVHPKLPDYDNLLAKFESLRSNRR